MGIGLPRPFRILNSSLSPAARERGLNVLKARSIYPVSVSYDRLQTPLADIVATVHSSGRTEGSVTDKMISYTPETVLHARDRVEAMRRSVSHREGYIVLFPSCAFLRAPGHMQVTWFDKWLQCIVYG